MHQQTNDEKPAAPKVFHWPCATDLATNLAACLPGSTATTFDPAAVSAALDTVGPVVVIWCGPAHHLSECLRDGLTASAAINDWKATAQSLLTVQRRNRRKLILAEASGLRANDVDRLAERLGAAPFDLSASPDDCSPLGQALAALALEQDTDLRHQFDELAAASLVVPANPGPDLIEDVVSQALEMTTALSLLQDQMAVAQTATDTTALRIAALESQIATMDQGATALKRDLSNRDSDLNLLRNQLDLDQQEFTRQIETTRTAANVAALQARTLQAQLAVEAETAAALKAEVQQKTSQATKDHETIDLLKSQINLGQDGLADLLDSARTSADIAELQARSLQAQLAVETETAAALKAEIAAKDQDFQQKSAEQQSTIDLLQSQIALTEADLTQHLTSSQTAAEATTARIAANEGQFALHEKSAADLKAELDLLRAQINLGQDGLAQQLVAANTAADIADLQVRSLQAQLAVETKTAATLTSQIAAKDRDIQQGMSTAAEDQAAIAELTRALTETTTTSDLLLAHIDLLQDSLAQALTTPAQAPTAEPTFGTLQWENTLAKALADARSEADKRARLEKELDVARYKLAHQTRVEEEQRHQRKLFVQIAEESTAALDEIARLSATPSKPGKGLLSYGPPKT